MPTITIEITDEEWVIAKTILLDPEQWLIKCLSVRIGKCINKVYQESTGKIAKKVSRVDKISELSEYKLIARKANDDNPKLKFEKKKGNK